MAEGGLETGLEGPTDERLPSLFCQPALVLACSFTLCGLHRVAPGCDG